jgi:cytochrome c peroxidase
MKNTWWYGISISVVLFSCSSDEETNSGYMPTPATLDIPTFFAENILPPIIPENNPQTVEGIALGRRLFFEKKLSGNGTQACADCHSPQFAFSDPRPLSIGADGEVGFRNSMPLFNLAWNYDQKFFWDGRAISLEEQILEPITSPIEMNNTWTQAITTLQNHSEYPELFEKAFGATTIDSVLVTKAIAQFIRTMVSGNSRFDRYLMGKGELTPSELRGFQVFMAEEKGDCFHCHGSNLNPLWTDNLFRNNGLDATFSDLGLGNVTGDPRDNGKFRTPSLRNLAYTAPYMHDGRFATIDDVINHYSEGLVYSETIDPLMKAVAQGGVQLSDEDKQDLKAFILSLSDPDFINNPQLQNPNP